MKHSKSLVALSIAAALGFAASTAQADQVYSFTNLTAGFFDASSGTRTFNVSGLPTDVKDVNITISYSKCDGEGANDSPAGCVQQGFSFNSEIVFSLTHGATTVNLVNAGTYTGQEPGAAVVVTFDEDSNTAVGGALLQGGSVNPVGNLDNFVGQDPNGLWTLNIADTVGADQLGFYSATLEITVPEPASLALLGLGLAGLGFSRRRLAKKA